MGESIFFHCVQSTPIRLFRGASNYSNNTLEILTLNPRFVGKLGSFSNCDQGNGVLCFLSLLHTILTVHFSIFLLGVFFDLFA